MVEIVRNNNVQRVRFYAAGENGRKKAFIAVPRDMIDDLENVDKAVDTRWDRAVAFGLAAEVANSLIDKGVELLGLKKVRVRGNDFETDDGDVVISNDLVVMEWDGSEAKKLMAELKKKAKAPKAKPRG